MEEYTIRVQFLTIYFDDAMAVLSAIDKNVDFQYPGGDFASKEVTTANKEDFDIIKRNVKERLFIGASLSIGREL